MESRKSIRDFFKPVQPVTKPAAPFKPAPAQPSSSVNVPPPPTFRPPNSPKTEKAQMGSTVSSVPKSSDQRSNTSSLSPPPTSDPSERAPTPQKENVPISSLSVNSSSDRVIQNSDDEDDDDSDNSL